MSQKKHKRSRKPRKRKSRKVSRRPRPLSWRFPDDIPTSDYLGDRDLHDPIVLEEVVADFIYDFESDYFLQWEAVVAREQRLPLTQSQRQALAGISYLRDRKMGTILYIDETPRPHQPWYENLQKILSHILLQPFKSYELYADVFLDGWLEIVECLAHEYARELSLPAGIESALDVIPQELQHRLWLQTCFGQLYGVGQRPEWNLHHEPDRIDGFLKNLRRCTKSIRYLQLTSTKLMEILKLPPPDEEILLDEVRSRLDVSMDDLLLERQE